MKSKDRSKARSKDGQIRQKGGQTKPKEEEAKPKEIQAGPLEGLVMAPVADSLRPRLKAPPSLIAISLLLLMGIGIFVSLQLSHLSYYNAHKERCFYDDNVPLMATPDAYYYLRLTSDLINGNYHPIDELRPGYTRPHPIPLLVSITAFFQQVTDISIERIAFYLPVVFASLMVLIYILWGYEIGGAFVTLAAILAGISSAYWCYRTRLGFFDTDCLNPIFFYLIIFCVYRFAAIQSRRRFLYLGTALFLSFLFRLWWPAGGHLGLLAIAGSYSTSFFVPSSNRETWVKIGSLGVLLIVCLALLFASMGIGTDLVGQYAGPILQYFILMKQPGSVFPDVGESISELGSLSGTDLAALVSGHEVPFILSILGLVFLLKRRKELASFLLPGALSGLASVFSQRFIIFFVPAYALGLGYLLGEVVLKSKYLQKIRRPDFRLAICALILVVILSPGFYSEMTRHHGQFKTAYDVKLAKAVAESTSPRSVLWAWWDAGYFLQYMTGRKTMIDGGSQSPQRTFIVSHPLASEDATLAGNWIRFFADRNPDDLGVLLQELGDLPKVFAFLQEVLANPAELESILARHQLKDPLFWRSFLFPEVDAYLFLDYATLSIGAWWYYFGTWDPARQRGNKPDIFYIMSKKVLFYDQKGVVIDDKHVFQVERVITLGGTSSEGAANKVKYYDFRGPNRSNVEHLRSVAQGRKVVFEPDSAMVLDYRSHNRVNYFFDGKFFRTLACRLLLQDPYGTEQFTPRVYLESEGGAWRAE